MLKNTDTSYGIVSKTFHWLLFLMLTAAVIAGNILESMPKGQEKLEFAGTHKSIGLLILMLVLLRLLWRLINVTPQPEEGMTSLQASLAHAMHWSLYALMLAQSVVGILMSQAAGFPVSFFGLFELPALIDKSKPVAEFFHGAHGVIWILLAVAVLGHAGVALHHHFVKKDGVLKRMTFGA